MDRYGRTVRFFFLLPFLPNILWYLCLPLVPILSAGVYRLLGSKWGLIALGVPLGLAKFFPGWEAGGWIALFQWVVMGLFFVEAFSRFRSMEAAMGLCTLATLVLQTLLLTLLASKSGTSPWPLIEQTVESTITAAVTGYSQMGVLSAEQAARIQPTIPKLAAMITAITPGIMFSGNLVMNWWVLLALRRMFGALRSPKPGPDSLRNWRISLFWVWLTIGGGVLVMIPTGLLLWGIGVNILIVMGTVHFFQGMTVVSVFFREKGVPTAVRGLLYVLIATQIYFLFIVTAAGLFDLWIDFRNRWTPKNSD